MKAFSKLLLLATILSITNVQYCIGMEDINTTTINDSKSTNILCQNYKKVEYDTLSKQYIDDVRYAKPEYSTYMQFVANTFNKLYENFDVKNEFDMHFPDDLSDVGDDEIESTDNFFNKHINVTIQPNDLRSIHEIFQDESENNSITIEQLFNYLGNKINELKVNTLKQLSESIIKQPDKNKELNEELIKYEKQRDALLQEYNAYKQNNNKENNGFGSDHIIGDKKYGPSYEAVGQTIQNKLFDPEHNNNLKIIHELLNKYYSDTEENKSHTATKIMQHLSDINKTQTEIIKQSQRILEDVLCELEILLSKYFINKEQDNNNNDDNKTITDSWQYLVNINKTSARQFEKLYYAGSKLQSRFNTFHNKLMRTLNGIQKYFKEHEIPSDTKYLYISPQSIDYTTDMYLNNKVSFKTLLRANDDKSNRFREVLKVLFNDRNVKDALYYLPFGSVILPNIIEAIMIAYDKVEQQITESLAVNHTLLGPVDLEDCIAEIKEPITCYLTIVHNLISFIRIINDPYLDYIEAFCSLYDLLFLPGLRPARHYEPGESPAETIEEVLDNKDGHLSNYKIEFQEIEQPKILGTGNTLLYSFPKFYEKYLKLIKK